MPILHRTPPAVDTPDIPSGIAPTWSYLCGIEPRLAALEQQARSLERGDWHSYERLKRQLQRLVGWSADHGQPPELVSVDAYAIALERLLAAWEGRR
jgi:hypothetical protein